MRISQCILNLCLLVFIFDCTAQSPKIKRRADSFFGVHFDFHAQPNDNNIGASLTPAMVNTFLTTVKPDYIQVDTKGHEGISSYPTKAGVAARSIVKDPLSIFRSATSKLGIGLYSHFSGVIDAKAVHDHPDWARINNDGQRDGRATSLFGPYSDKYFIPQIQELRRNYGIDGVWVDGEVWAVQPDFSAPAKKAYSAATGKQATLNLDYMNFTRRSFHKYLDHYTSVLHKSDPGLQIGSNWAFSTFMPGPVDADVDFLTGDIVYDDVKNMTLEPRVFSAHNKPWDLMVWGFMSDKNLQGHYWKSTRQLQQKAAIILAQGGGFQVYINQNHDASIPVETAGTMKKVADFCFARKPYCFKAVAVPQVAIVLSEEGHDYDLGTGATFDQQHGGNDNIKGTLQALLNSQYSVQVLQEHQLSGNLAKYPLLAITEWNYLNPTFIKQVQEYVKGGGRLLLIGGVTCRIFDNILPGNTPGDKNNAAGVPVKRSAYGKGVVMGIDANISLHYYNTGDDKVRQTIAAVAKQLFPAPAITITGSDQVHVVLNKLRGETMIHLVNVGERWGTINGNQLDFQLPALPALQVAFQAAKKPSQILLQPGNNALRFSYNNGTVNFTVPSLDIYSIVEVRN